jgi:hypothetical protein
MARLLDAIRRRLPRLRQDIEFGVVATEPLPSWFQWGMLTRGGEPYAWYWFLRLPSYVHKLALVTRQPCWHQRVLSYVEPLKGPYSDWQGLHVVEFLLADVKTNCGDQAHHR